MISPITMLCRLLFFSKNNELKYFCALVISLFSLLGHSQLSDFNLDITVVDETCSGNGALQMTVSNTTAGSEIFYTLYSLPDDTTPIAETSAMSFDNLFAGTYRIVATQVLGDEENTQQQDVTIADLTTDLDFEISHSVVTDCDATGTISVNVTSGNAVMYEIISGPTTVELQDSNTFEDLAQGTYVIRVFDDCGNALSKTYTLNLDSNNLSISPASIPVIFDSCTEVEITSTINAPPDNPIIYPLTLTFSVFAPDGSLETTFVEEISSGASQGFNFSQNVMTYGEDLFSVQISISDSCNNVFESESIIDPNPKVQLFSTEAYCGKSLNLIVNNLFPPYQIDFTEAPDTFDPVFYYEDYPGPVTDFSITFEAEDTPVPYGTYTINVVDACGRSGTHTVFLEEVPLEPDIIVNNTGCSVNSGFINVSIPDRDVVAAVVTAAPISYANDLPDDVSEFITNGDLNLSNLSSGDYTVLVTDECGSDYIIDTTVPEFVTQELSIITKPNCLDETGSLRLASGHGSLSSVTIVSAPSDYSGSLPEDVSDRINNLGIFFMNNLPAGNYTFALIDECGFQYNPEVYLATYVSTPFAAVLTRNCGSFDIGINDQDETVVNQTYWFQRYFPESDTWGHPYNGTAYTEGTIPNATTAIEIENEETLFNIFLTGDFRLIKVFQPFNNEQPDDFCLDVFTNFTIYSDLVIDGVYNLSCAGGSGASDVIVDVIGVPPYNFSIISPFVLDNGESNVFTNLDPGTYEVRVEDVCGSIENTTINIENLLPVVRVNQPDDLLVCSDNGADTSSFSLTDLEAQILGNQDPNDYTVTFHLTQDDANSGNNPLPPNITNDTNPQRIYVRVIHNTLDICYATTSFQIEVGSTPILNADETISLCDDSTTTLTATPGYDAYQWSTGETTPSITVSEAGIYSVEVQNNYGQFSCDATQTFSVLSSNIATIESISTTDWTVNNNTISITVSGSGNYVFSIDGINYQAENSFTNLIPGEYHVFIKDLNGCGIVTDQVFLLSYPNFFTPNNDGYNDQWHINFAHIEPAMEVIIFDRYGKLLTAFTGNDFGWDGTYNGKKMPTSDYWFMVKRTNGQTYRGHFTLKR